VYPAGETQPLPILVHQDARSAMSDAMQPLLPTYSAYGDEAQYNFGRYRGVGIVSLPSPLAVVHSAELRAILSTSGVEECKWEKVRSGRGRLATSKLLHWTLEQALNGTLAIDVLTWDTEGADHRGHGPHHLVKLRYMYAMLLESVVQARAPHGAHWRFYPDEQTAITWDRMAAQLPTLSDITPSQSQDEPLIQIADLFVGLGVFSRNAYDLYEQWLCGPDEAETAPTGEQMPPERLSGSIRQRCLILDEFFTLCKLRGLGVSLRTQRGLRTYDQARPISFAWYAPTV
jgi:hypothetical protein